MDLIELRDGMFQCKKCHYKNTSSGSVKKHINSVHGKDSNTTSPTCKNTIQPVKFGPFKRIGRPRTNRDGTLKIQDHSIQRVTRKLIGPRNKGDRGILLECIQCHYTSTSSKRFQNHARSHKDRDYICTTIGCEFSHTNFVVFQAHRESLLHATYRVEEHYDSSSGSESSDSDSSESE